MSYRNMQPRFRPKGIDPRSLDSSNPQQEAYMNYEQNFTSQEQPPIYSQQPMQHFPQQPRFQRPYTAAPRLPYSYPDYNARNYQADYPGETLPQQPPPTSLFANAFAEDSYVENPLVRDMAMTYGSKIVDSGKQMVDKELSKLNKIKFYFLLDTSYVINKLKLILFPYYNSNWSPKLIKDQPVVPREDINAPDMYIPLMAYVTYVLLAGYLIGKQSNGFSPEVLGVLATQALGYLLIELAIELITMYITYLKTCLSTWDLVAFSGYKFVGMIVSLFMNHLVGRVAYYISITYCGISIAFFLVRSFKWRMIDETQYTYNADLGPQNPLNTVYQSKRRFYFLLLVACIQPLIMWWLSYDLEFYNNFRFISK